MMISRYVLSYGISDCPTLGGLCHLFFYLLNSRVILNFFSSVNAKMLFFSCIL